MSPQIAVTNSIPAPAQREADPNGPARPVPMSIPVAGITTSHKPKTVATLWLSNDPLAAAVDALDSELIAYAGKVLARCSRAVRGRHRRVPERRRALAASQRYHRSAASLGDNFLSSNCSRMVLILQQRVRIWRETGRNYPDYVEEVT
jgi:hypothetical protein